MFLRMRIALAFLTILPIRLPEKLSGEELAGSAAFFPLAGWVIGALLAGAAWLTSWLMVPPFPAAVVVVSLEAWFTRGLHLDGLADLIDALGGGDTPAKRLAIMKDSAVGAFGVVGLVCLLLLKTGCIAALLGGKPGGEEYLMLAAVPAVSRWAMAVLAFRARYPRETGTGHPFVGKITFANLAVGALLGMPVFFLGTTAGFLVLAGLLPTLWLRRKASQALGGVTGDVLGAACESGEAAAWLAALLLI